MNKPKKKHDIHKLREIYRICTGGKPPKLKEVMPGVFAELKEERPKRRKS